MGLKCCGKIVRALGKIAVPGIDKDSKNKDENFHLLYDVV